MTENHNEHQWHRHPEAETYVAERLAEIVGTIPQVESLASSLMSRTSCHLYDWLDHLVLATGDTPLGQLADLGFEPEEVPAAEGDRVYYHPGAILPRIVLRSGTGAQPGSTVAAAIQVEDISFFMMTHHLSVPIEGALVSPFRSARIWEDHGREFLAVERRGHQGFVPVFMPPDYAQRYLAAFERWATRPRDFADQQEGMVQTLELAGSLVSDMGTDTAAWIAFEAERAHWQRRNQAGQIQKARQDSLGLGWANHDHHTFRSSRDVFPILIKILETFGFESRERFFAGAEAGWGAQVMEQPVCRFAVFADVDLSPEEVEGDFAHRALPERDHLGTVGLWCALHGEAMLSAGLHHLAARVDFDATNAALAERGADVMHPFSEFSYLKQAFTKGERWKVAPDRADQLVRTGMLNFSQHARFTTQGAIGSHLEIIQRGDGFKGFNQARISDIIRRTDPRDG